MLEDVSVRSESKSGMKWWGRYKHSFLRWTPSLWYEVVDADGRPSD